VKYDKNCTWSLSILTGTIIPEQVTGTVEEKLKLDKLFILELLNALHTGVDEKDIKTGSPWKER
jgi:hypothetical protein